MELKDFMGKVVVGSQSKRRYILQEITSPYITAVTESPDANGRHVCYKWETINGDPISRGVLLFEDSTLTAPFKTAYDAYCRSKDGYWEEYGYWMRKD